MIPDIVAKKLDLTVVTKEAVCYLASLTFIISIVLFLTFVIAYVGVH